MCILPAPWLSCSLFDSLTEEQKDRYEAFMRAALPKQKIKKVHPPCTSMLFKTYFTLPYQDMPKSKLPLACKLRMSMWPLFLTKAGVCIVAYQMCQ